ncbi:PEP-CTERM sorting domain-containing protein [Planctomycetota bacterium]|nr:PEP-CTERM sorting domain-containing protein [Planctomycetota bacterium]
MNTMKSLCALSAIALSLSLNPISDAAVYDIDDPTDFVPSTFFAGDTINLSGTGIIGIDTEAHSGSIVNVYGGTVEQYFTALGGSIINIFDGNIGNNFFAIEDSIVNISGGTIGENFDAGDGSTVNIHGGHFLNSDFHAYNSTLNIHGGTFDDYFSINSRAIMNLYGSNFKLDGIDIAGIVPGTPFIVPDRGDVVLSATLEDGSAFDITLDNMSPPGFSDVFYGETMALHLVPIPEPTSLALLSFASISLLARRRKS